MCCRVNLVSVQVVYRTYDDFLEFMVAAHVDMCVIESEDVCKLNHAAHTLSR